jgi:hypothetical protein
MSKKMSKKDLMIVIDLLKKVEDFLSYYKTNSEYQKPLKDIHDATASFENELAEFKEPEGLHMIKD